TFLFAGEFSLIVLCIALARKERSSDRAIAARKSHEPCLGLRMPPASSCASRTTQTKSHCCESSGHGDQPKLRQFLTERTNHYVAPHKSHDIQSISNLIAVPPLPSARLAKCRPRRLCE